MINKRRKSGSSHTASWFISFADLMSLLMAFFVMLLSFSVQDQQKLEEATSSVKNAFGIMPIARKAGMIEREGNPQRDFAKHVTAEPTVQESEFASEDMPENAAQGQEANTYVNDRTEIERAAKFAMAAASLKQAWQDLPDITQISDNLIMQDTEEGLNIVISDQEGRAMFPEGSKYPYEITRKAIAAMAPVLQKLPNQIRISGNTAAGGVYPNERYGKWELSFDRANVTRQILEEFGVSQDHIHSVVGRGDSDPFFPNDPFLAANQRVSILILYEKPPVPVDLTP